MKSPVSPVRTKTQKKTRTTCIKLKVAGHIHTYTEGRDGKKLIMGLGESFMY